MTVVAWVLALGILVPLLLLAVPVHIPFRAQGIEPIEVRLRVLWLFGLVRIPVRRPRRAEPGKKQRREAAPSPAPASPTAKPRARPRERRRSAQGALTALRDAALRRRVWRLVRDLLRAIRLQRAHLHARLGLGDPADTGRLWALLGPLQAMALRDHGTDLRIEPDFSDAVLQFDSAGRVRLIPLQILALALAFLLSPVTLRALWRWRRRHEG